MTTSDEHPAVRPGQLGRAQQVAVAGLAVVTAALAAYGAAGSYLSVRHLAVAHHVPLPGLVPVGIDGGLAGTVALDVVLTWIGAPLSWLRAAARLFIAGTVAANVLAGWPDPVAAGLHAAAPLLVLLTVEAGRSVLLRAGDGGWREPIPATRWMMAPWPTFVLWRRMVLWRINSYAAAIDTELARRQAIIRLAGHYGSQWRAAAPSDLVWMLRNGVRMAEACARVEALTAPPAGAPGGQQAGDPGNRAARRGSRGNRPAARAGNHARRRQGTSSRPAAGSPGSAAAEDGNQPPAGSGNRASSAAAAGSGTRPSRDAGLLDQALRIAGEHAAAHGRRITVAELALRLGRRKQVAGELLRQIGALPADGGGQR